MKLKLTLTKNPKSDEKEINILTNEIKPEERKNDINKIHELFKELGLL